MRLYHHLVRWMRWMLIGVAVSVGLAVPAWAAAAPVLAPPGHAGASQYVETIPTSAGSAAPPGSVSGSGNSSAGARALFGLGRGASTDRKLSNLGQSGRAAAALAAGTAPTPVPRGAAGSSANSGGSFGAGIAHLLAGSDTGGLGVALPLMLGTGLLVALGFAVGRLTHRASRPRS